MPQAAEQPIPCATTTADCVPIDPALRREATAVRSPHTSMKPLITTRPHAAMKTQHSQKQISEHTGPQPVNGRHRTRPKARASQPSPVWSLAGLPPLLGSPSSAAALLATSLHTWGLSWGRGGLHHPSQEQVDWGHSPEGAAIWRDASDARRIKWRNEAREGGTGGVRLSADL